MTGRRASEMLISLHEHFPARVTDWLLSAILFSWGLSVFFMAPAIWALPTYSGLAAIAPKTTWGIIAIGLGMARLVALFVNGAVRRSPHLRCVGAFLSIFIWVQISLGLIVSNAAGDAAALMPWLALADMFNVHRAAKDARISDTRAIQRKRSAAGGVSVRA